MSSDGLDLLNTNDWYLTYNEIVGYYDWDIIGYSSEERPILSASFGEGSRTVLVWAGMHGNETTGVFALLGLIDLFQKKNRLLEGWTMRMIVVANPDAYVRYTRRNGLGIDMNRDFRAFETLESSKLIGWIKSFEPEICFNLHDQRTIFHVNGNSAYTSFLVPSEGPERNITPLRRQIMNRLGKSLELLNISLDGIGRYTDEFYPTAIGDYLMSKGIPNILIESGVSKGDMSRVRARKMVVDFILAYLNSTDEASSTYDELPENSQGQLEWVFTNVHYARMRVDIAVKQVKSVNGHSQSLLYKIDDIGDLRSKPRLHETDGSNMVVTEPLLVDMPVNAVLGDYIFDYGVLTGESPL
jgi:hypothetical protein